MLTLSTKSGSHAVVALILLSGCVAGVIQFLAVDLEHALGILEQLLAFLKKGSWARWVASLPQDLRADE